MASCHLERRQPSSYNQLHFRSSSIPRTLSPGLYIVISAGKFGRHRRSNSLHELKDMETTARSADSGRAAARRMSKVRMREMPSEEEIEEFFAEVENKEMQQFVEKYNYDLAKDAPLEGRYEWTQLKR